MHLLVGQIEQCVHTRPRQFPETIDLSANHHHFRHALAELFKGPPGKSVVRDGLHTRSLRFGQFGIQGSLRKSDPFELDLPYTQTTMTFELFHHAPGFYDSCRAALRDKGVPVSNLLNNDARLATHLNRMRRACDGNLFCTTTQCGGNVIAVGLKRRAVPRWDDLHARAKAMTTSMGLDLCRHVKRMEHHHRGEPVSGYPSSGKLAVEQDI